MTITTRIGPSSRARAILTAMLTAGAIVGGLLTVSGATAGPLQRAQAAFAREDFTAAARTFIPLAQGGNPVAQAYLGFMFEYGRGVPQSYSEASYWYRRAAEQGNGTAQYSLGLLYDKGFGVRQDLVEADKWLNLSAASASKGSREYRTRLRDAVASKMTRGQIAESRRRALEWYPQPELPTTRVAR
ncbi:TPR repeat protein [Rhodopseudomonas rhenobacensis]|uniref:TPR repeat protein n=1 Tax=Rhodopseudomonas rhenobacensis TaxID=87461 RepID=A0A7W8E057_9BRAD|nr:tetratricopeptide repeat protein [Rhodopseudomonas rhenobacensis]MBB5048557.1 TPR repeat protein [Rhodopseudomonas rhenobacensis]